MNAMLFDLARDIIKIAGGRPRSSMEMVKDGIEVLCAVLFGLVALALTLGIWVFGAHTLLRVVLG